MIVTPRDADPVAFGPFGAFIDPPAAVGDRAIFSEWLEPVSGRSQQCHVNRVARSTMPVVVEEVECHPHAPQLFVPMGEVSRYLVTVMPSDASGAPDRGGAQSFVVPGSRAVVYAPGTWHTGIKVLDGEASFAVFMWRGGEDDDVFAPVDRFEVDAPHG